MAHAYTTKRGKNKKSKLGVRKDHQQNLEKALKTGPSSLQQYLYDGPKESTVGVLGRLTGSSSSSQARLENVKSRLQKALMDKCSNPECSNVQEGSSLSECSACHQTRYCSKDCQKAHWPEHKELCKSVRKKLQEEEEERQKKVLDALKELNVSSAAEESGEKEEAVSLTEEAIGGKSVPAVQKEESEEEEEDSSDEDMEDINDIN